MWLGTMRTPASSRKISSPGQLLVRQDAALGNRVEQRGDPPARLVAVEPEACHGRVVGGDEVATLVEAKGVDLAADIDGVLDRGHAVIGAHEQAHLVVVLARQRHQLAQALLVPLQLGVDLVAGLADLVQQGVHRGHVEEGKRDLAFSQAGLQRLQVGILALAPVGAVVFRPRAFEAVEDALALVHAAGPEQVALLAVVETVDQPEGHVVKLEIALESVGALDQLADPVAHATAVGQAAGQPAQHAQRPERRTLAGMVEERPVAVIPGLVAGQDRWHAGRGEAEHRAQLRAEGQFFLEETPVPQHFPAQGVDEDDDGYLVRLVAHVVSPFSPLRLRPRSRG
jgi:hypothetical protein